MSGDSDPIDLAPKGEESPSRPPPPAATDDDDDVRECTFFPSTNREVNARLGLTDGARRDQGRIAQVWSKKREERLNELKSQLDAKTSEELTFQPSVASPKRQYDSSEEMSSVFNRLYGSRPQSAAEPGKSSPLKTDTASPRRVRPGVTTPQPSSLYDKWHAKLNAPPPEPAVRAVVKVKSPKAINLAVGHWTRRIRTAFQDAVSESSSSSPRKRGQSQDETGPTEPMAMSAFQGRVLPALDWKDCGDCAWMFPNNEVPETVTLSEITDFVKQALEAQEPMSPQLARMNRVLLHASRRRATRSAEHAKVNYVPPSPPSIVPPTSPAKFLNESYKRMQQRDSTTQERLDRAKQEAEEHEKRTCTFHPTLVTTYVPAAPKTSETEVEAGAASSSSSPLKAHDRLYTEGLARLRQQKERAEKREQERLVREADECSFKPTLLTSDYPPSPSRHRTATPYPRREKFKSMKRDEEDEDEESRAAAELRPSKSPLKAASSATKPPASPPKGLREMLYSDESETPAKAASKDVVVRLVDLDPSDPFAEFEFTLKEGAEVNQDALVAFARSRRLNPEYVVRVVEAELLKASGKATSSTTPQSAVSSSQQRFTPSFSSTPAVVAEPQDANPTTPQPAAAPRATLSPSKSPSKHRWELRWSAAKSRWFYYHPLDNVSTWRVPEGIVPSSVPYVVHSSSS